MAGGKIPAMLVVYLVRMEMGTKGYEEDEQ